MLRAFRCVVVVLVFLEAFGLCWNAWGATKRILVVGDSWARYFLDDKALSKLFTDAGLGVEEEGTYTAVSGTTAEQFAHNVKLGDSPCGLLDCIQLELNEYGSIDIVHLSLGANDILWHGFYVGITDQEIDMLVASTAEHIAEVVDFVLALRRDVKVLICDYDYFNFVDTLTTNSDALAIWKAWGKPTAGVLNNVMVRLGEAKRKIAQARERVGYVQNWGLMQFWFGYPPDIAVQTVAFPGVQPKYEPYPGGLSELPSPIGAMADIGNGVMDPLHLNSYGYVYIAANCYTQYYSDWLQQAAPTFASIPSPYNTQLNVATNTKLSWRAGTGAVYHDVYFGEGKLAFAKRVTSASFSPGPLKTSTTYVWRVDELAANGNFVEGDVWAFTTAATEVPTEDSGCLGNKSNMVSLSASADIVPFLFMGTILAYCRKRCI